MPSWSKAFEFRNFKTNGLPEICCKLAPDNRPFMQQNKFITIGVLLLVFALSVLVRLPNLDRPLSKHHEFVTTISLRILQIWDKEGAAKYNFNPVMNYPGKANKFINNHASTTGTMRDSEGNYYYVSHPPFAYIMPHAFHQLLHIKPTNLSLQIFHLLVNLVSALFIYLIVCLLGQQKPFAKLYISGLVGVVVYLFNPGVLWFQTNTYMSDMLVHLFFILGVYTMLKLLMRKRFFSIKYLVYYSLFLFLMIYTSWLGLFFAFAVFLYSLIKLRNEKVFLPLIFITIGVSFFALWLIVKQYSIIAGTDAFVLQMLDRVSERGSLAGSGFFGFFIMKIKQTFTVIKTYMLSYLPIFLLLITFGWLVLTKAKLRIVFTKNGYRFLWLSTLPVLLLHFTLLNYSGHHFVSLYGSLFLSVLIAILYDKLRQAEVMSRLMLNAGVVILAVLSVAIYYYINRPGAYSWKGDYYAEGKDIGEFVKVNAEDDEVVFYSGKVALDPQIIVYAERNMLRIKSEEEAMDFLQKRNLSKGVWIHADNEDAFLVKRLELEQ